jgi:hypothetical protein
MKSAYISATFPELKGKFGTREGRGEGSNASIAISRAIKDLLKQVKRKQFTTILSRIIVIEKQEPVDETVDNQ